MNNAIEIYKSSDGNIKLDVKLENDTVWLTQSQMSELFGKDCAKINHHMWFALCTALLWCRSKSAQMNTMDFFNVIDDYVYALDTLDNYDYQSLSIQ